MIARGFGFEVQRIDFAMDGTGVARLAMQDYRNFPLFLTEEVWRKLLDDNTPQFRRLECLVTFLVVRLGLRHASELTQAVVASVIEGGRSSLAAAQTALLNTVKSVLKTASLRAKHSGTPLPAGQYLASLEFAHWTGPVASGGA